MLRVCVHRWYHRAIYARARRNEISWVSYKDSQPTHKTLSPQVQPPVDIMLMRIFQQIDFWGTQDFCPWQFATNAK